MFIIGLVFIICSFIIIGQFVIMPILLFLGIVHSGKQELQQEVANNKFSKENGKRSLELLKSELNRVAGSNTILYKRGKYVVTLKNPTDNNIKAARKQFKMRGITNYKVK